MKGWGGSCRGGVRWVKTQTQNIITHRVLKNSQMDIRRCVWAGESFSSHDK